MASLSETEAKDYLMGILVRIENQYDSDKMEYNVDFRFKLPLVGDSQVIENSLVHGPIVRCYLLTARYATIFR